MARSRFAFGTSAMVIAVGLLGPWLGALADYKGRKKAFMGAFLGGGALLTAAFYFVREGQWVLALALYGLANVAVTSTLAFYNALLPGIARPDEVDRVSTAGFALGYLGGGLLFALNLWMMASPATFGLASATQAFRISAVMVAAWWVLFSIPLFRRVPEPAPRLDPASLRARAPRASRCDASGRRSASSASTGTPGGFSSPSSSTTTASTRSSAWARRSPTRSACRRVRRSSRC